MRHKIVSSLVMTAKTHPELITPDSIIGTLMSATDSDTIQELCDKLFSMAKEADMYYQIQQETKDECKERATYALKKAMEEISFI